MISRCESFFLTSSSSSSLRLFLSLSLWSLASIDGDDDPSPEDTDDEEDVASLATRNAASSEVKFTSKSRFERDNVGPGTKGCAKAAWLLRRRRAVGWVKSWMVVSWLWW